MSVSCPTSQKRNGMWQRMSTGKGDNAEQQGDKGEKLKQHPSLLLLPSDAETVLLWATIRAREGQKEGNLETSW